MRPPTTPPRSPWLLSKPALFLACLLTTLLGMATREQFNKVARMKAENRRIEHRIQLTEQEIQELRKAVAALETPQGMEREARRQGFVKKGEVPLILPR